MVCTIMSILNLDDATLAKALLIKNVAAITQNVPLIESALDAAGILTPACAIAAHSTVAVETAWQFQPINEYGNQFYFLKLYDIKGNNPKLARRLGNTIPGDGIKFHGRGFIQITGRSNYALYGIVTDPDQALRPAVAAEILADFFKRKGLADLATQGQWTEIRKRVNGGINGLSNFMGCVTRLNDLIKGQ